VTAGARSTLLSSGKVRDVYDAGDDRLLMIASDRISAFDWVFPTPVPDKGRVLTAMTAFFAELLWTTQAVRTHLLSVDPADFPGDAAALGDIAGRAMLVRRAEMLPLECIVRGYLAGSALKEYQALGTVHGRAMPAGLEPGDALPEPIFTPSTKAAAGHDVNLSLAEAAELVGHKLLDEAMNLSLAAYRIAAERAAARSMIVADTKFELGKIDGELAICDEIVTPDSSRLWSSATVAPGEPRRSFDKQPVRDWVEATGWDKASPPPVLPEPVVEATRERYVAAYEQISGRRLGEWWGS
jgi:phosphoribosylaminoimidazole-succinocarboxamide synthase